MDPTPLCQAEIVRLHDFFQSWFNGTVPDTDEAYAPLEKALAAGIQIIGPHGAVTPRAELLETLRTLHARDQTQPIEIRIENVSASTEGDDLHLVTYEEWQTRGAETRGRRSSALLRATSEDSFEWLHVHETWLPAKR